MACEVSLTPFVLHCCPFVQLLLCVHGRGLQERFFAICDRTNSRPTANLPQWDLYCVNSVTWCHVQLSHGLSQPPAHVTSALTVSTGHLQIPRTLLFQN